MPMFLIANNYEVRDLLQAATQAVLTTQPDTPERAAKLTALNDARDRFQALYLNLEATHKAMHRLRTELEDAAGRTINLHAEPLVPLCDLAKPS
jgi:hypothetical protein